MAEQIDVLVIGAGHNGLTAAAVLARGGLRVTVLEARDVLGGAAVAGVRNFLQPFLSPALFRSFGLPERLTAADPDVGVAPAP